MNTLSRLEKIRDIRTQWPNEAYDFTRWMAQDDSLALLGETLGFGADWLELVETEASVGKFSADLYCRATAGEDDYVVIENQFGQTDHDHLGKLLTYAAGLKAKTVIWVAEHIREEHRAAIDMLNAATADDFQFFGLEIELWQIADSPIAPRFSVIAKPNEWTRQSNKLAKAAKADGLTDLKKQYIRYWTAFKETLENHSNIRAQKASPQQWIYMPIGRANFTLTANVHSREKWIQAQLELHQDEAPAYFALLKQQQQEIEATCPIKLRWEPLPNRKGSRIAIRLNHADPTDETDWERQHTWLVEHLNILRDVFRDRVLALDLSEVDWTAT